MSFLLARAVSRSFSFSRSFCHSQQRLCGESTLAEVRHVLSIGFERDGRLKSNFFSPFFNV